MKKIVILLIIVFLVIPFISGCSQKVEKEEQEITGFKVRRRPTTTEEIIIDNGKVEVENETSM